MKLSLALLLAAASPTFVSAQDAPDIVSAALLAGSYGTFVAVLGAAGLTSTLTAPSGPFTVFAPQDSAFAALPAGLADCLLLPENYGSLDSILSYHIVSGEYTKMVLDGTPSLPTLNPAGSLYFGMKHTETDMFLEINNVTSVIDEDIDASNGIIQGIDTGTHYNIVLLNKKDDSIHDHRRTLDDMI